MHRTTQRMRSYMHKCDYFWIQLQTSNGDSYRNEWIEDHKWTNQIEAYVGLLRTWGIIPHKWFGMINFPLPGSAEVQCTRRHGATAWTMYTITYPSKLFSGFQKRRKEPKAEPWIDIEISGPTLWPIRESISSDLSYLETASSTRSS